MWPAEGESFDPRGVRKAVRDAGFSAPEVTVTAVGRLASRDGELFLESPGAVSSFVLSGGEVISEIRSRDDLAGQQIRVSGQLHADHADQPPGLIVEGWEVVSQPPEAGEAAE